MMVLIQFLIGLLFGIGLIVAGMADPAKVQNFLDVAAIRKGNWDASLAFVMAGGIAVTFIGYRLLAKRERPILADAFQTPTATVIDQRLLIGAALFGVGWGLAGFCPGPAFVALGLGRFEPVLFVIAMLLGMASAWTLARRT